MSNYNEILEFVVEQLLEKKQKKNKIKNNNKKIRYFNFNSKDIGKNNFYKTLNKSVNSKHLDFDFNKYEFDLNNIL
tara:strand:- start:260 stop:487 length:228 start_codon:yes stop_codon:yes gene_type:complete